MVFDWTGVRREVGSELATGAVSLSGFKPVRVVVRGLDCAAGSGLDGGVSPAFKAATSAMMVFDGGFARTAFLDTAELFVFLSVRGRVDLSGGGGSAVFLAICAGLFLLVFLVMAGFFFLEAGT